MRTNLLKTVLIIASAAAATHCGEYKKLTTKHNGSTATTPGQNPLAGLRQIKKHTTFDSTGKAGFQTLYSPTGDQVSQLFESDGTWVTESTVTYSGSTETRKTFAVDGTLTETMTNTYNSNSKLTTSTVSDGSGALERKTVFEFDASGQPTAATETDASGTVTDSIIYTATTKHEEMSTEDGKTVTDVTYYDYPQVIPVSDKVATTAKGITITTNETSQCSGDDAKLTCTYVTNYSDGSVPPFTSTSSFRRVKFATYSGWQLLSRISDTYSETLSYNDQGLPVKEEYSTAVSGNTSETVEDITYDDTGLNELSRKVMVNGKASASTTTEYY